MNRTVISLCLFGCANPCADAISAADAEAIAGGAVETHKGYTSDHNCSFTFRLAEERAYATIAIEAERLRQPRAAKRPKTPERNFVVAEEFDGDGFMGLFAITEFTEAERDAARKEGEAILEDAHERARTGKARLSADPMGAALSKGPIDLHEAYLDTGTWKVKVQISRYSLEPAALEELAPKVGASFASAS